MDSDDNNEQTTETELEFSPETLQALGIELTAQIGQLDPIQREELMRAIGLTINQPGAATGGTPPTAELGVTPAVTAATTRAATQRAAPAAQIGQIIEGLRGGAQRSQNAQVRQAQGIPAGITSFVDPRLARSLQPTSTTSTSGGGPSNAQTGLQAAGTAAAIAAVVVA